MTDNIIALPFINQESVEAEIRRIAKESTQHLILLDHALDRMQQRDITQKQIHNVLKNGEINPDMVWDTEKEKGWKCSFQRVTAGVKVTVVAKLIKRESNLCLVVTVF